MVTKLEDSPVYGRTPDTLPEVNSAAELLQQTVAALSKRTPAIVAAAARELAGERVSLTFSDGSSATLEPSYDSLRVTLGRLKASVECFFHDHSLTELFDLERRPAQILQQGSFDARGSSSAVLAAHRTFQVLSQRAAGLRVVQGLWNGYRRTRKLDPQQGDLEAPVRQELFRMRYPMPDAAALLRRNEEVATRTASVATTRVLWDGQGGQGWWELIGPRDADLSDILETCRIRIAEEVERLVPSDEPGRDLYDLMRDYPARGGKGLRPALCLAACGAFGGQPEDAVKTAAAIEMFHNAFLIHDDISDESDIRRGKPCMHVENGTGLAVNAGDGLNLMAIDTLLGNIDRLGLARTLGLIHEIIHMCRETIEGQAMELGWIHHREVPPHDEDYFVMVTKKTGWYTCMSPCRLGAIAAGHTRPRELDLLGDVFHKVGVAFQIQDDLLNLLGKEELYGKEPLGDLLEGKRTLMLIHLMYTLPEHERTEVMQWLSLPRVDKRQSEAEWVLSLMHREGSIDHGTRVAMDYAARATVLFEERLTFIPESEPKAVLRQVANYVNTREL